MKEKFNNQKDTEYFDKKKEKILGVYREISQELQNKLGKLSNDELVNLKRITEAVVTQSEQEIQDGVNSSTRIGDFYVEIYDRWFLYYFGTKYTDLLNERGEIDSITKEYLRKKLDEQKRI